MVTCVLSRETKLKYVSELSLIWCAFDIFVSNTLFVKASNSTADNI